MVGILVSFWDVLFLSSRKGRGVTLIWRCGIIQLWSTVSVFTAQTFPYFKSFFSHLHDGTVLHIFSFSCSMKFIKWMKYLVESSHTRDFHYRKYPVLDSKVIHELYMSNKKVAGRSRSPYEHLYSNPTNSMDPLLSTKIMGTEGIPPPPKSHPPQKIRPFFFGIINHDASFS